MRPSLRLLLVVVQPAALSAWVVSPPSMVLHSPRQAPTRASRPSMLSAVGRSMPMLGGGGRGVGSTLGTSSRLHQQQHRFLSSLTAASSSGKEGGGVGVELGGRLKGVLWDMDGTLSDSEAIHWKAYQAVFASSFPDFQPNPLTKAHYAENMQGRTKTAVLLGLFPQYTDEERAAVAAALEAEYEVLSKADLKPLQGLTRLLDRLDGDGVAHAIVTNAPKSEMLYSLNLLGVKQRFSQLVPSEECTAGKPDPAPYLEGLRRLGLKAEQAIAIEDSPAGIKSATAAGLVTVGVLTTKTEEELLRCGASLCIDNYDDEHLWDRLAEWTRER